MKTDWRWTRRWIVLCVAGLALLLRPGIAGAQTATWTGAVDNLWSNAGNWSGLGGAPLAGGEDLVFPVGAANLSTSNDITAGTSFNSITISAGGYTLAGNSIALGAGNMSDGSTAGANVISLAISFAATRTISVTNATTTLTLSGVISGGGGLTKAGSGMLALSGANTYGGVTTVSAGMLHAQDNTALGTTGGATSVASGAALQVEGSGLSIAEPLTLNGTGITAGGALRNLANNNTWSGAITLALAARINSDAGTLTVSNTISATAIALTVGGAGNTTIGGAIGTTSGTLTKDGTGTLTLSGTNTYTGATTVSAGVLDVQSNAALGTTAGATTVASGAALQVDGSGLLIAEPLTLNGTGIAGGGALRHLANNNTWSGAISLATAATISADAGTLTASGGLVSASTALTIDGAGNVTFGTVAIVGSRTVTMNGAGTLTFNFANTYTGATTINAGTLKLGVTNGIAAGSVVTVASGATYDLNGFDDTIGSLAGAGTVTDGAAGTSLLTTSANTTGTFSGVLQNGSGTLALTKGGTGVLTLSGTNTYSGVTTINAGSVAIAADAGLGTAPGSATAGQLTFAGGTLQTTASFILSANRGIALTAAGTLSTDPTTTLTYGGIIAGASTLAKAGTGTLILSGANTYSGATTVSAGVLDAQSNTALGTTAGATSVTAAAALQVDGSGLVIAEPLTLNSDGPGTGGALRNLANNNTWSGAITLGSAARINSDGATLTVTGGLTNSGVLLTVGGAGNTTFNTTAITGTGGVTKDGVGMLILSAANSYTGVTTVSAGVVRVQNNTSLGTSVGGTTVASGAAVEIDGSGLAIADAITSFNGTGISSGGALRNLANNNTWSGTIAMGSAAGGRVNSDAGTLTLSGATFALGSGPLTVGGAGNTTISGVISASTGTVTKDGAGTLTLSGSNSYATGTSITAGILVLGVTNAIGASSAVTVTSTFDLNGFSDAIGSLAGAGTVTSGVAGAVTLTAGGNNTSTTFSGILQDGSGTLALIKAGTGTLTLSGANTYGGATTVNAGVLDAQNTTALGTTAGATSVTAAAALQVDGSGLVIAELLTLNSDGPVTGGALRNVANSNTWSGAITLGSAARINSDAGTLTMTGGVTNGGFLLTVGGVGSSTISTAAITGTGGLTKDGAGTLTLAAANSYSGTTTVSAGVLDAQSNTALGDTGGATSVTSGAALQVDGSGLVIAEPLTLNSDGPGVAGALRNLANNSTWSGAITLGSATRINSDAGTLSLTGGVTDGGFLLTVGGAGNSTISTTAITGIGGLTKDGAGTLTLNGANSYTGATTVTAGVVSVSSLADGGLASDIGAATTTASNLTLGGGTLSYTGGNGSTNRNFVLTTGTTSTIDVTRPGTTLTISGASTATTGALTKLGAGALTLAGTNLYTGLTTISAGTLRYGAASSISSSSSVTVNDGGTFDLAGFSGSIGALTVNSGAVGGAVTTGAGTLTLGGNVTSTGGATNASISDNLALGGSARTFTVTDAADGLSVSAVISGAVGLTKAGAGTLTLAAANTYTGATTVSAGVVRVQNSAALGTTASGTTVASGSAIEIDGTGLVIAEPVTSLIGTGISSGGALRNLANVNTWSAAITLGAGGALINSDADTLIVSNTISGLTRPLTVGGTGNTAISGVIGTTSGTLTKSGAGTLILSGANSYTGVTTVSAGVVRVQNNSALGTTAGATTVASGAAIEIDGSDLLIAEPLTSVIGTGISNGGALRHLANNNTWSGAITLGAAGARVNSDGGTLTVSNTISGATQPLTVGGAGNTTISGAIGTTSGTLTKDGAGTLTLGAANTYTGRTTISGGAVSVSGDNNLGTAPGSATAGLLTFDGGTLASTATFTLNANRGIALNSGGATFDVASSTTLTYSGIATGTGGLTKIGDGSLTLGSATLTMGNFTLSAGTVVAPSATSFAVAGNWSNSGTFTHNGGTVTLNGGSAQSVGGSSITAFNHLTISNASGITLGVNATVSGTLTFTSGTIITGSNALYIASGGSVARTSGHVVGNFKKYIATGATSKTFEVGDASNYTPVSVAFASVTVAGDLTASVTASEHPNISGSSIIASKSVNRYWTLVDAGIGFTTYSATFTFVAGDVDGGANTSAFVIARFSSGTWTYPTVGTRTSSSTQTTGLTSFSDFAVGEGGTPSISLVDDVAPSGTQLPGTDLAYTSTFTNSGSGAAQSVVITNPLPATVDFKLGSVTSSLGSTGLTVVVAYSNDGGSTWTYTPVSGAGGAPAGYDRTVTTIRWTFSGNLSASGPDNAGSVGFTARIQ